ncbi:MAG: hypothetical protein AB9915_01860 [Candidatus Dojkabacteria bacterium]
MFVDLSTLNNSGYSDLIDFISVALNLAISFSVIVAVISLIISGFKFILSLGDEKKIGEASRALAFSLIGLVLVFLSPTIIEFIIKEILTTK